MKILHRLIAAILLAAMLLLGAAGCSERGENDEEMKKKVLPILIDGMRPDALLNTEYAEKLSTGSAYTFSARTVYPSITLPCHISLFYSKAPDTHGVLDNNYTPTDKLGMGICELLAKDGKTSAMFYNWTELKYLTTKDSTKQTLINGAEAGWLESGTALADACIEHCNKTPTDFTFLYFGLVDEMGHMYGWLSEEYYSALNASLAEVERVMDALGDEYSIILTADHGGHDHGHGSELDEDMTIPVFVFDEKYPKGKELSGISILDIAPTVLKLLGTATDADWQGKVIE